MWAIISRLKALGGRLIRSVQLRYAAAYLLVTGMVLYLAGAFFVVEGLFRLMAWAAEKIRDSARPKEGKAAPGANCSVQKREDASSGAARE